MFDQADEEESERLLQIAEERLETGGDIDGVFAELIDYADRLMMKTKSSHMRLKIATALAGRSVCH